jgi:hypothetical protein
LGHRIASHAELAKMANLQDWADQRNAASFSGRQEPAMQQREPNIVTSSHSRHVTEDGVTVELCIYRLEDEQGWTLEVVNAAGTSTVWDDAFGSEDAAYAEFRRTVADEGMTAFLDSAKIIRFPGAPKSD